MPQPATQEPDVIRVQTVESAKELQRFIRLPWKIYRDDPFWVPPLIADVKSMLDRKKSPFFEIGEAAYFLAYRDGECVGRISAHINRGHNEYHARTDGFFGFFEAVDDPETAAALLGASEDWLRERGMDFVIGPESFTIYDEIGFIADGWDAEPRTPVVLHTYSPPYYLHLMEAAGYRKEIDWFAFKVSADNHLPISDAYRAAKNRIAERRGLVFRTIDPKNIDHEMLRIKEVMNTAWAENWGHYPYTLAQFDRVKEGLITFYDPRLVFLVETAAGDLVGVSITIPDINPAVLKMNGRLLPFGWYHFMKGRKSAVGARTLIMGVLKEYRNMGVDIALVAETVTVAKQLGYRWADCSLIVENNERMIRPVERWGGVKYRTYRLFSKSLV